MRRPLIALAALAGLLASGCFSVQRTAPKPGVTDIGAKPVTLPGHVIGNVLVVEDKWDKSGPYHFVIDTGSSVTLVSPELAKRYGSQEPRPQDEPQVRVRSSGGGYALLDAVTLKRIQLGSARFDYVPALVYDCADLSAQFGVKIDGILGFPLFQNAVLTIDYPHERAILRDAIPDDGLPGEVILFDNTDKTPLISIRLGDREFAALIDSGKRRRDRHQPGGPLAVVLVRAGQRAYGEHPGGRPALAHGPACRRAADRLLRSAAAGCRRHGRAHVARRGPAAPLHGHVRPEAQRGDLPARPVSQPLDPPASRNGAQLQEDPAYWKVVGVIPDRRPPRRASRRATWSRG